MRKVIAIVVVVLVVGLAGFAVMQSQSAKPIPTSKGRFQETEKIKKTDEEWRAQLTPMQFYVTRQGGTEQAFTGKYWDNKRKGVYHCVCCGLPLFDSKTKFKSGTGWPSFWQPSDAGHVVTVDDYSWVFPRTEVKCSRCDAHLGHVFTDGPQPTRLRYCINSAALDFEEHSGVKK